MQIKLIGAAIDQCAGIQGAARTPAVLNKYLGNMNIQVEQILHYENTRDNIPVLEEYYTSLANSAQQALANKQLPIVIGGDHSCAIGTWSGVSGFLTQQDETLGLIWIDAHMDAHTPETSPSGNIHGMPVAVLLGRGYKEFINIINKNPKLKPENLVLIGIRSYEEGEEKLLNELGIKIYYNHDVTRHGFGKVFNKAWTYLANQVDKIGLSIDVDGFDPEFTPGVGTAVADGVNFDEFIAEFKKVDAAKIAAIEISETNIDLDQDDKTINCVVSIIKNTKEIFTHL